MNMRPDVSMCPLFATLQVVAGLKQPEKSRRESAGGRKVTEMSKSIAQDRENIVEIQVDRLKACRIQPKSRMDERRIIALRKNIEGAGKIYQTLVVVPSGTNTWTIADGHRRWVIAKALGWTAVPCRVIDNGIAVETLFILLNADTARVTGADWLTGWALANKAVREELFEKYPRRASTINRAIDVYGEQRLVELGKGNCKLVDGASILKSYDPARASWALKLHSRLKEWATVKVPTPRGIGEVLLLPKMTGLAQDWLKNVTPTQKRADKIANALRRNSFPVADKWS